MRGVFTFYPGTPREMRISNIVVDEGESDILDYVFRGNDWLTGGEFYLGLCSDVNVAEDASLTDLTDEPSSAGGYERQLLNRGETDWPVLDQVNGVYRVQSKLLTFTASGANFSAPFSRAFISNLSAGTGGRLLAFSGALPSAVSLLDGQSFPLKYEFYLD